MNATNPIPAPSVSVPAVTPTAGAMVGGVIGTLASAPIAAATGGMLPPAVTIPVISGFFTWLFHFAHSKLGTPE